MIPVSYLFELVLKKPTTRVRGELYVLNNEGKLLLGVSRNSGNLTIPGGAVDKGETSDKAAIRETLEEVGIRVKNVKPLVKQPNVVDFIKIYGSWDRVPLGLKIWGHDKLETYSYQADFDREDKSLWNTSKDRRDMKWVDIKEYEQYIKQRIKRLKPMQKHLAYRMMHSLNMLKLLK